MLERQGRPIAQLVTDRAPYFKEGTMEEFNKKRGLEHIKFLPYSQEFNAVVERTFGTLLPMVRTTLIASCAPERAYGECFVASCYIICVGPHAPQDRRASVSSGEVEAAPHP